MKTIAYQIGEVDAAPVSSLHPNLGKRSMGVNAWRAFPIRYRDMSGRSGIPSQKREATVGGGIVSQ